MNDRYILLIASIAEANKMIVSMFGFAVAVVAAYGAINWYPQTWIKPARAIFLAAVLFIFITVLFSGLR